MTYPTMVAGCEPTTLPFRGKFPLDKAHNTRQMALSSRLNWNSTATFPGED